MTRSQHLTISSFILLGADPYPTIIYPDVVVTGWNDRLLWYHHNRKLVNDPYEINLKHQGMEGYLQQIPHPLLERTFSSPYDWTPDIDHGGNLQLALQFMLLQADPSANGKIHLLPAWPRAWEADFKLHAPGETVIEGSVRNGKLENLTVTPASRRKDIIFKAADTAVK